MVDAPSVDAPAPAAGAVALAGALKAVVAVELAGC